MMRTSSNGQLLTFTGLLCLTMFAACSSGTSSNGPRTTGNGGSGQATGGQSSAGSAGTNANAGQSGSLNAGGTGNVAGSGAFAGGGATSTGGFGTGGSAGAAGGSGGTAGSAGAGTGVPVLTQFDTSCLGVPDPDVAASQNRVGMVGQWTAYFYHKDGSTDHNYTWKALEGSLISDTHIVFDLQSQRWFMSTIVQNVNGAAFGVQVMVSTDETASSWKTSIPAHNADLIDNPQPTVSADKVLLIYHGNCAWVVDKTSLYNGGAPVVAPTTCTLQSADNWVAVKYGGMPPSTAYAVTLLDDTHLSWLSVDGTQAANNVKLQVHNITIPKINTAPVWGNGGVTVNGAQIEAGEVKAMWQNNHLYWAKTYQCSGSTCTRLFDINTSDNTVKTDDFSLNGEQLWFGVPGVDSHQNVWMLSSSASSAGPIGLAFMGKYASGSLYAPKKILDGKSQFAGSGQLRLGDYTSAAQDPDGSLWLIGMYAATKPNPLNTENSNAGCRVVHVVPQ